MYLFIYLLLIFLAYEIFSNLADSFLIAPLFLTGVLYNDCFPFLFDPMLCGSVSSSKTRLVFLLVRVDKTAFGGTLKPNS